MSIYGYLNCHDCRQTLWLGKAKCHDDYRPFAFHIGDRNDPPHWARPQLNQVLWKFLADHTGHRIDVRLEGEQEELPEGDYQDITVTAPAALASRNTSPAGRGWRSVEASRIPSRALKLAATAAPSHAPAAAAP